MLPCAPGLYCPGEAVLGARLCKRGRMYHIITATSRCICSSFILYTPTYIHTSFISPSSLISHSLILLALMGSHMFTEYCPTPNTTEDCTINHFCPTFTVDPRRMYTSPSLYSQFNFISLACLVGSFCGGKNRKDLWFLLILLEVCCGRSEIERWGGVDA